MSAQTERATNVLLTISALAIAVTLVARELRSGTAPSNGRQLAPPELQEDWREFLPAGIEVGTPSASTVLMVFNDFECGGCKLFHDRRMGGLVERGDLSIRLLHLPLSIHRFAPSAARAAECADLQGRTHAMVATLFAKQDSLGLKSWASYGEEAGVTDPGAFQQCVADTIPFERITASMELAERLEVNATPTLMLNGWLFRGIPSEEQLLAAIAAVKEGKAPSLD